MADVSGPSRMSVSPGKSDQAFRTISEVATELGVQQHILRYWETRFPQLKPLQRAGNRRYYRPADVALARRIHDLLSRQGYTVKGVQQLLASPETKAEVQAAPPATAAERGGRAELRRIRAMLKDALR